MASWDDDVADLVRGLPDARATTAHEGSPSWSAGSHHFARLRWDDGLLLDSYAIRGGVRRGGQVDETSYFGSV